MPERGALSFHYAARTEDVRRVEGRRRVEFVIVQERRRIGVGAVETSRIGEDARRIGAQITTKVKDRSEGVGRRVGGGRREQV